MSNTEMSTILKDLREVIAKEIEYHFLPLCICERCNNTAVGTVIQNIINKIRDEE